jgi:hypothetical protein
MATTPGNTASPILQLPIFSSDVLSDDVRETLLDKLWPLAVHTLHPPQSLNDFEAYLRLFSQECRPAFRDQHAIESYGDMFFILEIVRGNPVATLAQLRALIANANASLAADEQKLSTSIELVVRLWFMINIRITMPSWPHLPYTSIPWPDNQSLAAVLHSRVSQPSTTQLTTQGNFFEYFNVFDMRRMAGFRVQWTNDLLDHLVVKGSSVYLYYHVSVLKRLEDSASRYVCRTLYDQKTSSQVGSIPCPYNLPVIFFLLHFSTRPWQQSTFLFLTATQAVTPGSEMRSIVLG